MILKIEPFVGFGNITLGQIESEVIEHLGEPDSRSEDTFSDNTTNKYLRYENLGIELTFASDDEYKLTLITFESEETELFGHKPIGSSERMFLDIIAKIGISDFAFDSDFKDINSRDYKTESLGLSFWIQDDILSSISLFPKYMPDNETIIWPKEA